MSRNNTYLLQVQDVTTETIRRFSSCANAMDKLLVVYTIERMDKILNKYKSVKERKDGKWTYYKRIPSRYWHEMFEAYSIFREIVEVDSKNIRANIGYENKKKIELYNRLLPALGHFDKCQTKKRFNWVDRVMFDHFTCLYD